MSWTAEEARVAVADGIARALPDLEVLTSRVEEDDVLIEFAVPHRPGCRFGLRWPARDDPVDDLARHADTAWINLQELIEAADMGLPVCAPGEVTWLNL
jgi:hypothetical protein